MKKISPFTIWFGLLVLIMLVGIVGYMAIEHYTFIDSVYMTVITIATIGYREVKPLSEAGKIFNILFIIFSIAIFTYALSNLTRYIVSGEMAQYFKNRKLMNAIDKFSNHVIICGFGRHGQQAANILTANKIDFVIIDNSAIAISTWLHDHTDLVYIRGDATDDDTLIEAGIKKAKSLILTLPEDADNVFIVLSARSLNPDLVIVSRASVAGSANKLRTAGADHIILPEVIGGSHMATLISKPDVIEFINNLWGDQAESINIESIAYEDLPQSLKDKSIDEIISWHNTGVNCLGIKNEAGKFIINPARETTIHPEMKIMLFGTMNQIADIKLHFANSNSDRRNSG